MPLDWKFYADWDGIGLLNMGDFENGFSTWYGQGWGGVDNPTVELDDTHSKSGEQALKVTWKPNFFPLLQRGAPEKNFIIGRTYTFSAWVWVPSTGGHRLRLGVPGEGFGGENTIFNDWQLISHTWTATTTNPILQVWPFQAASIVDGDVGWVDRIRCVGAGGDVTSRVLAREQVSISYGRDQARALSPTGPAQASLALNNTSRDYSPENTSSPLSGFVLPNRDLLIEASFAGRAYTMFRGRTDNFDVLPAREDRAVSVTAVDALAAFRGETISTDLHIGITTGQAVHAILDAIDWPADARDIDNGATGIRFWWEERADAGAALERVINSEGPPATAFVSSSGDFVFRDRHHRLTRDESLTSQATFSAVAEPAFSAPLVYDQGWRDIVNSVTFAVDERAPSSEREVVWTSDTIHSIEDGETLVLRTEFSDPVIGAATPVEGTDYRIRSGVVTATLSRTSGASVTLFFKATGGPAVIDQVQLRAYPVAVRATRQVHAEDSESIRKYGRCSQPTDAPWATVHDAAAIAEVILGQRAERLPIVTFTVRSSEAQSARLTQQLGRDLSDRITIVDSETGLNDAFFIDRIEHTISHGGKALETVFGCEKAPTTPGNVFTFNVAGKGFNDGVFGQSGQDDPDSIFRFDVSGQGFDDGVFAH